MHLDDDIERSELMKMHGGPKDQQKIEKTSKQIEFSNEMQHRTTRNAFTESVKNEKKDLNLFE